MRRMLVLLLTLMFCFFSAACSKNAAVQNVENMIGALGELELNTEAPIFSAENGDNVLAYEQALVAAEDAYNALSDEEKIAVENYAVLAAAREEMNAIIELAKHEALDFLVGE